MLTQFSIKKERKPPSDKIAYLMLNLTHPLIIHLYNFKYSIN